MGGTIIFTEISRRDSLWRSTGGDLIALALRSPFGIDQHQSTVNVSVALEQLFGYSCMVREEPTHKLRGGCPSWTQDL